MVNEQNYDGVDIPEYFMSRPDYTPKELEERFSRFFKFADAEALVNTYNRLSSEEKFAEARRLAEVEGECGEISSITLDALLL